MNANQCGPSLLIFLRSSISGCSLQNLFQPFNGQSHSCRTNRCDTMSQFKPGNLIYRLHGSVTEIVLQTSVEMQVYHARNQIHTMTILHIHGLYLNRGIRTFRFQCSAMQVFCIIKLHPADSFSLYPYVSGVETVIFCKNIHIFNTLHSVSARPSFHRILLSHYT